MRPAAETGIIYDIGYQRYEGARLGRGYAFRTLVTHSLRAAWGLGRGGKALIIPFVLLAIVLFPAVIQVIIDTLSQGEGKLLGYSDYFEFVQGMVVLYCAAQAPELVSTDQHARVLPLYFSRSVRRVDYAAAKLLAMVAAVWLLVFTPMVVLFLGRISAAADVGAALRTEGASVLPILGSTLFIALALGSLAVGLASLTERRALASAAIFGMVVLTTAVNVILVRSGGDFRRYASLLSPVRVLANTVMWLFKVPYGPVKPGMPPMLPGSAYAAMSLAFAALGALILFTRYSRVRV